MARVSFHTLGCKLNYAESGTLARDFERRGFRVVPWGEPAEVAVVNTCSVTDQAESKCRNAVRRALRSEPQPFVVVTGCYAQLRPEELARIPGVDLVLGAADKFHLFDLVDTFAKRDQTQVEVSCIDGLTEFGPSFSSGERTRAFLKVQDGCDYTCSFCTIPRARGRSRSHGLDATVGQAQEVARLGVREIVLTGVNIGLYGGADGVTLLDLIRRLDEEVPVDRFRISSIEPNLLTDDIIAFVAGSRAFQPHFHLPLQSGDDEVLGKMRRRYRRALFAERVAGIRSRLPEAAIGVDVIVGFPGESEAHFQHSRDFLADLDVSYLHVFTYSERPGTVAAQQVERDPGAAVSPRERARRSKELRLLSLRKRRAFYQRQIGAERPVLWETEEKKGRQHGWTDNYVRVSRAYDPDAVNRIDTLQLGDFAEDGSLTAADGVYLSLI